MSSRLLVVRSGFCFKHIFISLPHGLFLEYLQKSSHLQILSRLTILGSQSCESHLSGPQLSLSPHPMNQGVPQLPTEYVQ